MSSFYRNWHKPAYWYRTKKQELDDTWWPKIHHNKNGTTEFTFTKPYGMQITFTLDAEQTKHLVNQLIQIKHV